MPRLVTGLFMLFLLAAAASMQSCTREHDEVNAVASGLDAKYKACSSRLAYQEFNASLPVPTKDETRVVFMGDSITSDWVLHGFGEFFLTKPYINRGVSGEHTPQILCRFQSDVVALKPKIVVLLAGTNDIKYAKLHDAAGITRPSTFQAITENIAAMAEQARASDIVVILASLLPVSDYDKDAEGKPIINTADRPPDQIEALNKWIKEYADRKGYIYLDYHSAMKDEKGLLRDELTDDGLHPNHKGYAAMAQLVEQAIARAQTSRNHS